MKKRPDITSMSLQHYVGENYLKAKKELDNIGLISFCIQEGKTMPSTTARDVEIRFDKNNGEIIRIWRA
mgnify:FL=1